MRNLSKIVLILLVLMTNSCRKEPIYGTGAYSASDCDVVFDYSTPYPVVVNEISHDRFQYKFPVFNPNNSSEIIYHYIDWQEGIGQIIKYNQKTGQKTVLKNNLLLSSKMAWSRDGWIAYETTANTIFVMKEDGSNNYEITADIPGLHYEPTWMDEGNVLVWRFEYPGAFHGLLKRTVLSVNYDTLSTIPALKKDICGDILLIGSGDTYYQATIEANKVLTNDDFIELPIGKSGHSKDICFNSAGTKFYTSRTAAFSFEDFGLFEVDFPFGNVQRMIKSCDSKWYETIDVSSDGKFILTERVDAYLKLDNQGDYYGNVCHNSSVYIVYINSGIERKIELE